jgi:hypothetical protein
MGANDELEARMTRGVSHTFAVAFGLLVGFWIVSLVMP